MVAVTYGVARSSTGQSAERAEPAAPRKSWFARIMDAMVEARMQQARRELRMHTQLPPYAFGERGHRLVETESEEMPFGGW